MNKILALFLTVMLCAGLFGNNVYAEPGNEAALNAENHTYYVDNTAGNDSNDGLTEQSAWKSLEKVNATVFQPGDKICFKAGGIWDGMLYPKGSGSAGNPIILDMYGEGSKPLIQGNGAEAGIKLESQEYWTIRNFEVTNHADERAIRQGIFINGRTDGITHDITIEECEVHDVTGENRRSMPTYESMYWNSGIYVSMPGRSTEEVHYDNVLIRNNYVHDVLTSGIRINQREDFIVDQHHTNVLIEGNTISRTGSDGMIVANCISPLIQHNLCYDAGALGNRNDTKIIAGLWTCGTDDAVFQYNEVARTVLFDSDGTAFDTDWGTGGVTTFQYNYTHGNQGGFWLDCAGINKDPEHIKTVLRYNVSADDERYIVRAGDMPTEIYNNTFYKSEGKLDACFENAGTKHKFWNNIFYFQGNPDWASSEYENNLYYPCEANSADTCAVSADPQLINPMAAGDGMDFADCYKISNTSPCIGTGAYLPDNGGQDFWGTPLTKGSIDIGACQTSVTDSLDEDTYVLTRDFSTQQGKRNWYYMESSSGQYQNLTWDESQQKWAGSGTYNLIWAPGNIHPDENDTVLAWKAPKSGRIQVLGNPRKENSGNDGVNVKIMKNSTQVWPESGWQYIGGNDTAGVNHDFTLDVTTNDMIYFVVNKNQTNYSDGTYWNPMITYHVTEKYNFSNDFSNVQGANGWYYLESDGSDFQELSWDSSINRWKGSGQYNLVWAPAQIHPDEKDTVLGWKAPHAGEVTIKGNPKKANTGYDGVKVKILKNSSNVWPESGWNDIGGSDTNGIIHDVTVSVSQGDLIYFVVNQNENNYSDETYWSPTITYN